MLSGILNVNKPPGLTSFAVVSIVRRVTGVKRVGHAGTLDPIAEGVLPICLGHATRVVEYLVDAPKAYRGTVRLGVTTDTYDSEGTVVDTHDPSGVTREDVEAALLPLTGEIEQLPPMYSALKHEGRPLYRYARAGKEAPRAPRRVKVYRMELRRFEPPEVELDIECGRGAYVRTLAHDLGQALGVGGHLEKLTRTRSGPFTLDEAITLDELRTAAAEGWWEELLYPVDRVLESWRAAILERNHALDVRRGKLLILEPVRGVEVPLEAPCRAYSEDGDFLGVLRYRGGDRWHPEKVFLPI
jgi:tRNA pseudouridine55 synthase